MRTPLHPRARLHAPAAWLGSALILFGGAMNLMAFVTLATIDQDPLPPASATIRSVGADRVPARASSTPHAVRPAGTSAHHHPEAARAIPHLKRTVQRPATGQLTAGDESSARTGHNPAGEDSNPHPAVGRQPVDPILEPTPTPAAGMPPATHIAIAAVGIDSEIVDVTSEPTQLDGRTIFTWQVADWVAGHHDTSADPGEGGNIVLSGHDDVRGEVFRGLHDISLGDQVTLTSPAGVFTYVVTEIHFRDYHDSPLEDMIAAGGFLAPMPEERVTLVTCWPYRVDTHRMIVVAKPRDRDEG